MPHPSVCAIMLANGREAMVKRAIRAFYAQTYPRRYLLIFDTTPGGELPIHGMYERDASDGAVGHVWSDGTGLTIGALRNKAIAIEWTPNLHETPDIIAHWDSDDWSHPNRLAEQVALLQAEERNGVQVVGYRDMLFYNCTVPEGCGVQGAWARGMQQGGEAWLYQNVRKSYCVGTSLCYWRRAWEARPFADLPKPGIQMQGHTAEDDYFHKALHAIGASSFPWTERGAIVEGDEPRMIASIHGDNYAHYAHLLQPPQNSPDWKRVPGWDEHCRKVMAL